MHLTVYISQHFYYIVILTFVAVVRIVVFPEVCCLHSFIHHGSLIHSFDLDWEFLFTSRDKSV